MRARCASLGRKRRVVHLQRLPDRVGEVAAERLAGDLLDDGAEDVERQAVLEDRAGLVDERQLGQRLGHLGRAAHVRGRAAARPLGRDRAAGIGAAAVGEARGVAEQVVDQDRPLLRLERDLAVGRGHADLHGRESREVVGELALQRQARLLGQRQRADGDHRLGHRRQLEDRVGRRRHAARLVGEAERLEVDELALARDRDDGAGDAVALDLAGEEGLDAAQPLARHADALGRGAGKRLGVRGSGAGEREGAQPS